MKKTLILLSLFLLVSCSSDIDPEIADFINDCSLEKAKESTETIDLSYSSLLETRVEEEELGKTCITFLADFNYDGKYRSYIEETFSGEDITLDQDSQLYVTYAKITTRFDISQDLYVTTVYKEGYKDKGDTIIETYTNTTSLAENLMSQRTDQIFYSANQVTGVSGGLYYADFYKSVAKYTMYMSIDGDTLVYQFENVPFQNDEEEGLNKEKIVMNDVGMVDSLNLTSDNFTTHQRSIVELRVNYNGDVAFPD